MSSFQGALPSVPPSVALHPSSLGNPSHAWTPPLRNPSYAWTPAPSSSYASALPPQAQTHASALGPGNIYPFTILQLTHISLWSFSFYQYPEPC